MSDDPLSGLNDEELIAKYFEPMARRFHISVAAAEEIYDWVMREPTLRPRANVRTWTTECPTQIGLYWYRRDAADKPFIVEVSKLKHGLWTVGDLDQGMKCESWDGYWSGPLEPPQ